MKLITFFVLSLMMGAQHVAAVEIEVLTEPQLLTDDPLITLTTVLVEKVLHEAELKYTIKVQPWARIYHTAIQRENVLIFPLVRNQQSEHLFNWIAPLKKVDFFLYGLPSTEINSKMPLATLNNYRISAMRESAPHRYLRKSGITNIHLVNNSKQSIKMLLSGRVDLIAGYETLIKEYCLQAHLDCADIKPLYQLEEASKEFYFVLSKKTDIELVKKIKAVYTKVNQQSPVLFKQ